MRMIQAILADDEKLSLQLMKKRLEDLNIEISGIYSSAEEVINDLKNVPFNTAFLDIHMSNISGLDLAAFILDEKPDTHIVFVTAHSDYALKAFELETVDYLLKPVLKERLTKTVHRIQERLEKRQSTSQPQQAARSLKIQCFQRFSVYTGDTMVEWKTAKVKELFAFFILHFNTPIHRDVLIDTLWPEHDYKKAKTHLHTCVSYVRKLLHSLGHSGALTFLDQHYTLYIPEVTCDLFEFETFAEQAFMTPENIRIFEQTVDLYKGKLMEMDDYTWAALKGEELSRKVTSLLNKLAEYYDKKDGIPKKLQYLHEILRVNPYSEHTLIKLMTTYAQLGMRAEAVRLYEEFQQVLQDDIGIQPNQEIAQLFQQIQQGIS